MASSKYHYASGRPLFVGFTALALAVVALLCAVALVPAKQACAATGGEGDSLATAATSLEVQSAVEGTSINAQGKKLPSVTITPKTDSPNLKLRKSDTYTKQLKNYWVISYYMNLFEQKGGGTLTLKKGTYQLPISIQVPSNVTIVFEDGVTIKKITNTGTSRIKSNTPLFQMIAPSKYSKTGAVSKYNGTKNVKFVGEGNVVFDMGNLDHACAIIMAQNQNMNFSGITFKNIAAHAFELDASKNVTIEKCSFLNSKSTNKTTEAINLDTPDTKTGGFSFRWSKMDKTPNMNVTIQNCTFKNLNRGVGTHKYSKNGSKDVMHTNIKILNNKFTGIKGSEGAISGMNWKNVTISGNTISGKGKNFTITENKEKIYSCGIVLHSVQGANISDNVISDFCATIAIRRCFSASGYGMPAAPKMSAAQLKMLSTNKYKKGTVTYPEASMTTETHYYWKMFSMWTPNTMARHFETFPLIEA